MEIIADTPFNRKYFPDFIGNICLVPEVVKRETLWDVLCAYEGGYLTMPSFNTIYVVEYERRTLYMMPIQVAAGVYTFVSVFNNDSIKLNRYFDRNNLFEEKLRKCKVLRIIDKVTITFTF